MSITSPDVISMPNGSARRSVDQDRHRSVGVPSIQADQDCGGIGLYRHTGQSVPLPEGRGTCRTSLMGGEVGRDRACGRMGKQLARKIHRG